MLSFTLVTATIISLFLNLHFSLYLILTLEILYVTNSWLQQEKKNGRTPRNYFDCTWNVPSKPRFDHLFPDDTVFFLLQFPIRWFRSAHFGRRILSFFRPFYFPSMFHFFLRRLLICSFFALLPVFLFLPFFCSSPFHLWSHLFTSVRHSRQICSLPCGCPAQVD